MHGHNIHGQFIILGRVRFFGMGRERFPEFRRVAGVFLPKDVSVFLMVLAFLRNEPKHV